MPPKAKFKKEEIINAAFEITRAQGLEKLTARELGNRLGSSARPIFTVFENMDQVKAQVVACAKEHYRHYIERGLQSENAFRGVGLSYITFAMEEPQLFQLLFMSANPRHTGIANILPEIDASYGQILKSVQEPHHLSRQAAERVYQHLWTYTHGIAAMCVTKLCDYTMEEIAERLTEVFKSLLAAQPKDN